MRLLFKKDDKIDITFISRDKEYLKITFQNIDDIKLSSGEIIAKILKSNPLTNLFGYDEENINELLYCILKGDKEIIPNFLSKKEGPFMQMNYHFIEKYMTANNILKDIGEDTDIVIECDKNTFVDYLKYISKLNGNYYLYSRDISLSDFYNIFKYIDIDKYGDVVIDYQDFTSPVSIKELYNICYIASETIELATLNDLSPLEQIILVYDRIKRREYKKDDNNSSECRDIDKILKGDSIVCIGYANLFSAVLSSLNIDNKVAINIEGNHARNIVHIIDDKYNIDAVYYFDVTGDSKKKDDEKYIDKYNCFAMTLEEANYRMKEKLYDYFSESIDNIPYLDLEDEFELAIKGSHDKYIDCISYERKEEAIKLLEKVKSKYNKELDIKAFALALYNVREVEYDMYIIDNIDLKGIKNSIINKYLSNIIMKGLYYDYRIETIKDLKLDLYIEMCQNIIPLLDKKDKEVKKLIKGNSKLK